MNRMRERTGLKAGHHEGEGNGEDGHLKVDATKGKRRTLGVIDQAVVDGVEG